MAQMKDGQHQELKEILSDNKRFFKPYSTSHISDILSGYEEGDEQQNKIIERDLDFISTLTNNYFLSNDGKDVVLNSAHPEAYYRQRIAEINLFTNLSFDSLLGGLEDNELLGGALKTYVELLKQIPLDDVLKNAFDNPDIAKYMNVLLPGLKDNLTMGGFMDVFGKLFTSLNDSDKYKDLRSIVQSGLKINRDKIFDSKNPYEIIEKGYKKLGVEMGAVEEKNIGSDKYGPKWFNEITNHYIQLDMYGYQEDKVRIDKGRKETFKNTTEDAFHAAFATTCNFYVTNDEKSYKKTKKIYEKLTINTLVFKPVEFVEYYRKYLDVEEKKWNLDVVPQIAGKFPFYENKYAGGTVNVYYMLYYLFNFFNKIIVIANDGEPAQTFLSRVNPTNGGNHVFEIITLFSEICDLFGSDTDGFGEVKASEFEEPEWIGRRWAIGNENHELIMIDGNIYLHLIV